MHSTFDIDMPHYANAIVGADEIMGQSNLSQIGKSCGTHSPSLSPL